MEKDENDVLRSLRDDDKMKGKGKIKENDKTKDMDSFRVSDRDELLTTNVGVPVEEDDFLLKAGERGPGLMQDFQFFQKIMHFTKERIPERVVHARGTGVHGEFELYKSMAEYTSADFLQTPGTKTPIFARLSTFQGFRGSPETVRDIRGFAIKFYTNHGVFDLTNLSFPVFFIHDAMKFPDLVHAAKPEPQDEMPQAQTAHDNFWDFVSQNQETAHAVLWLMSDRGIPRSFRMMAGFGVNTYKFINKNGEVFYAKFHVNPVHGTHSLMWDESQKIAGKDPDFLRKDLMEAVDRGQYPEWEFGIQILPEKDEFMFDFDILDVTKLWPEELVPVIPVGKIVLNRNVDNFFAETEQSAFNPANLVPGIDISDDPVMQGRMLAYFDTQMYRLGGPNYNQLPINRPVSAVHNYQRDGFNQMSIHKDKLNYRKNRESDGLKLSSMQEGGYHFDMQKVNGSKLRGRSKKFLDFFSQATMYYNSLMPVEQKHLIMGFQYELSKVKEEKVRQNVVNMFAHVDERMAHEIAQYLGLTATKTKPIQNAGQGGYEDYVFENKKVVRSEFLSQETSPKIPMGLKLAVLVTESTDLKETQSLVAAMEKEGIVVEWIEELGYINGTIKVRETLYTTYPTLFDGIMVTAMKKIKNENIPLLETYIDETYMHYKPILIAEGGELNIKEKYLGEPGIIQITSDESAVNAMTMMRFWDRNTAK